MVSPAPRGPHHAVLTAMVALEGPGQYISDWVGLVEIVKYVALNISGTTWVRHKYISHVSESRGTHTENYKCVYLFTLWMARSGVSKGAIVDKTRQHCKCMMHVTNIPVRKPLIVKPQVVHTFCQP